MHDVDDALRVRVLFAIKRFIECEGTVHVTRRGLGCSGRIDGLRVVGYRLGGHGSGYARRWEEAEGFATLKIMDVAGKDDVDPIRLEDGGELTLALVAVVSHRDLKGRHMQGDELPRLLGGLQVLVEPSHNGRVVRLAATAVVQHDDVGRAVVERVEAEGRVVLAGEGSELGRGFTLGESCIPNAFRQAVLRGVEEVVGGVGVVEARQLGDQGVVISEHGVERDGGHHGRAVLFAGLSGVGVGTPEILHVVVSTTGGVDDIAQ